MEPKTDMPSAQIYLMSPIFDQTAEDFCRALDSVPKDMDCTTLMNCPGGSVFAGWTMIGKMKERTGKNNAMVYGHAASMAMFFLLFCDHVEALEVTKFLIHRASGYVENEDDKNFLDSVNADLRKHMEKKLDIPALEKLAGCTMDDIFNGKDVKDVWISAKDAKKICLINETIRLTPEKLKAYNEKFVAMIKPEQGSSVIIEQGSSQQIEDKNNSHKIENMTRDEFKAQNPLDYAAIVAEGKTSGITAERERVKSWLAFHEYDAENVIKMIGEGTELTPSMTTEMNIKVISAVKLNALHKDATGKVKTKEVNGKTKEEEDVESFEKEVVASGKKIVEFNKI
jgi:ATP-dependent protease ClpP protease subunit